jgi:hypothetical protein
MKTHSSSAKAPRQKAIDPIKATGLSFRICFVGLVDKRQVDGIDQITEILQKRHIAIEHFEYKIVKKTETRRAINPKHQDGPKEKVTIEERINVNANLRTMYQLEWRVLKDPENVLLLQLGRLKGEALSLPLILPPIIAADHAVLITGLTERGRQQLIAQPDLSFRQMPAAVEESTSFREHLLQRIRRSKGMQATARELLDFHGLPDVLNKKIAALATGKSETLTNEEAVNLILLSDLVTRYSPLIRMFQNEVTARVGSVAQMARQFEKLTEGLETDQLIAQLGPYLGDEGRQAPNAIQLFHHLYQRLQQMKEGKLFVKGQVLDVKSLFGILRSLICITRSQQDPGIWKQCLFYLMPFDNEALAKQNRAAILQLALKSQKKLLVKHVSSARSLIETFSIYRVADFVIARQVRLSNEGLPALERHLLLGTVLPRLWVKSVKMLQKKGTVELFGDPNVPVAKLTHSVHCIGAAYGLLQHALLGQNLSRFLRQGPRSLLERFNRHFFDIMFEQGVLEPGLPISRACFAQWLAARGIVAKPENYGYIPGDQASDPEPQLTVEVLLGSGQSLFPTDYTQEQFARDYLDARQAFTGFLGKFEKMAANCPQSPNPAPIILSYLQSGRYNLRSSSFRKHVRETFLFSELKSIVVHGLEEVGYELDKVAVSNKAMVKIPARFEWMLLLGHTFAVNIGKRTIQIRLHVLPVNEMDDSDPISTALTANLDAAFQQAERPERKGLIQAVRLLGEYQRLSQQLVRYLGIIVVDRLIGSRLQELDREACPPNELKASYQDSEKLLIGSVRNAKLNKLFRFDHGRAKNELEMIDYQSIPQMLESIMYWQSIKKDLEKRQHTVSQIIRLLGRFSKTLKQGEEWKTYSKMVRGFNQLISRPIEHFNNKTIQALTDLSFKLNRLVSKREYKDNAIAILYAEWKRKHPNDVKKIYFYTPFIADDGSAKSSLLQEIRRSHTLVQMLKRKRCVIYLPEGSKTVQFKQMAEIAAFLDQENLGLVHYIETGELDEERLTDISKVFYPKLFFQLDKLELVTVKPN